ncbi:hypothetical protein [Salinibacterium sp. TMP30]
MKTDVVVNHEPWVASERERRARHNVFIQAWRFARMSFVMFLLGHRKHDA